MTEEDRNIVAFRREMDQRFHDLEKLINHRFDAQDKAVLKAEEAMTIRLDHMNEFRAQVTDERINYATKADVAAVQQSIHNLEKQSNMQRGRDMGLMGVGLTAIFSVISVVIRLIGF